MAVLALLAGCNGGGSDDGERKDVIVTPDAGQARQDLADATKPLLKPKPTACAVTVLSGLTGVEWLNISETLMKADMSLEAALSLQTPALRKQLNIGDTDVAQQTIPVQVVILDRRITELRIEGADLRTGLEAAGVTVDPFIVDQVGKLSQAIQYVKTSGAVKVKVPRDIVNATPCPTV